MGENEIGRRGRVLSPEAKWEIFLQVTSREMTQCSDSEIVSGFGSLITQHRGGSMAL